MSKNRYEYLNSINIPTEVDYNKIKLDKKEYILYDDTCIVYTLWDNIAYINAAVLSIFSLYLYTDAQHFKIYVVLSKSIIDNYPFAVNLFESLGCNVVESKDERFKYSVKNHIPLKHRFIINIDADAFFYGSKNPIFATMHLHFVYCTNNAITYPYTCYNVERDWTTRDRFELAYKAIDQERVFGITDNIDDWYSYFTDQSILDLDIKQLNHILDTYEWPWNVVHAYDRSMFDTWLFDEHSRQCFEDLELWDDEFVYFLYLRSKNLPIQYLNVYQNTLNAHYGYELETRRFLLSDYNVNDGRTKVMHPLNSYDTIPEEELNVFFNKLTESFLQKYGK